jgi:hypothetical protein
MNEVEEKMDEVLFLLNNFKGELPFLKEKRLKDIWILKNKLLRSLDLSIYNHVINF